MRMDLEMRMTALTAAFVITSIVLSALAQVTLKIGMTSGRVKAAIQGPEGLGATLIAMGTSPYIILGLSAFGLSALFWLFVLSRIPLSTAYPMIALGIVLTVLAGRFVLLEPISLTKATGVFLIVLGVILVGSRA